MTFSFLMKCVLDNFCLRKQVDNSIPCIFSSAADSLTSWSLVVVSNAEKSTILRKVIFRSLDENDELIHLHVKLLAKSVQSFMTIGRQPFPTRVSLI